MIIKTITAYINPTDVDYQDGGQAQIITVNDENEQDLDEGIFVRIQSWYEKTLTHPEIEKLKGKRVKVTIETLDEEEKEELAKVRHFKYVENAVKFINEEKIKVISICSVDRSGEGCYVFYR